MVQDALAEKLRCRGAVSHRHVLVRAWGDRDLHGSSSPCCDLLLDLTPRRGKPPAHYVPEVKSTICWELAAAPNWFPTPQSNKHPAAQLRPERGTNEPADHRDKWHQSPGSAGSHRLLPHPRAGEEEAGREQQPLSPGAGSQSETHSSSLNTGSFEK